MPQLDDKIKVLHNEATRLLNQKLDDATIIESLATTYQIEKYYAETILENVKSDRDDSKQFNKHLFSGIFIVLACIAVAMATYQIPKPMLIWAGFAILLIGGITQIARAFILFRK
jgi:hypothetical protein